jgi:hypothetical protein
MAHTKLGIVNNKNIPMSKTLNRTSMFESIQKKDINTKTDKSNSLLFENKNYKLVMFGNKLNHKYDYPLLALIIKYWLNSQVTNNETKTIKINLSEIYDVFNFTFDKTKNKNYIPISKSIERLHGATMRLDTKEVKIKEWSSLINNPKMSFGEFGYIEVEIGNVLKKLYGTNNSIELLGCTFIDINKIILAPSEPSKGLMKFFMTQSKNYIDFKLVSLCKILGYELTPDKQREYVKKALKELVKVGFLTTFKTNNEKSWQAWDEVRIIPATLTKNLDDANKLLITLKSNFDLIKNHHRKAKNKKNEQLGNDEIPF